MYDKKIEYLKHSLGVQTMTQVLTEAIHHLYSAAKAKEACKNPFEVLEELQLIGRLEGKEHLFTNYKEALTASLHQKHGSAQ